MRKGKRWTLWAGAAGVIAIIVAGSAVGATGATDQRAQNLRVIIAGEPPSLDPGLATDTTSASVLSNLMESLITFGPAPQLKAVPGAAQSWVVKGANVTLNLRKDVKWTTGQPVTAQDYVYSWLRTISPGIPPERSCTSRGEASSGGSTRTLEISLACGDGSPRVSAAWK